MKKAACLAALAAVLLSGCGASDSAYSCGDGSARAVFDYFFSDDMPWNETMDFEMSEFPNVRFSWDNMNVLAEENGETRSLYWGMPVWSVYLADLNGDGKREICSAVSIGSGIIDERIIVYDYANDRQYQLAERFYYDYGLELRDGALFYVRHPAHGDGDETEAPLTLDAMTELEKPQI
ncbi:MAG: hypothetical protein NC299_12535 [Lachnospiraceae bacterium]|nr:hypothetical protein [Ruminococcus sp.]MCM1276167.1 hypothetical protein [Lachnospiraceae bacterium]